MTINEATRDFILTHRNDDIRLLALQRTVGGDVDMPVALEQIAGWQTAQHKLPSWAATEGIVYPPRLSMEQCSGETAARYKQGIVRRLTNGKVDGTMCDLTGGAGVDFSFMAPLFSRAVYVERQDRLCDIARNNMPLLELKDAEIVRADAADYLQTIDHATLIFLDPARRDAAGRRTYAIADCTPDILVIKETLLAKADIVMLKLSPMLDINKTIVDLNDGITGNIVREVHIVATGNECKELLVILSLHNILPARAGDHKGTPLHSDADSTATRIFCVNDNHLFVYDRPEASDSSSSTCRGVPLWSPAKRICPAEVAFAVCGRPQGYAPTEIASSTEGYGRSQGYSPTPGMYIYEPNAAVMKAGCFGLLCQRFSVRQINPNSHLFVSEKPVADFPGRGFVITAVSTMNKKDLKTSLAGITHANISVRNFPLSADELRRRLRLKDGGDTYIFATTASARHLIIVTT